MKKILLLCLLISPLFGHERGDILVRARGYFVLPTDEATTISSIPNSGVDIHPTGTGEGDITFMLHPLWGMELSFTGVRLKLDGTKNLRGLDICTVWMLPLTLTWQYHMNPCGRFQPYIGVGANSTWFNNIEVLVNFDPLTLQSSTKIRFEQSWGVVGQAGLDYYFCEGSDWFFNLDFKYVHVKTTAHYKGTTFGKQSIKINPIYMGAGVGIKF